MTAPTCQTDGYAPVSCHPIIRMVNFPDQRFRHVFLDIIIRLSVFPDNYSKHSGRWQAAEALTDVEFFTVLFHKPISLGSISFAKNVTVSFRTGSPSEAPRFLFSVLTSPSYCHIGGPVDILL